MVDTPCGAPARLEPQRKTLTESERERTMNAAKASAPTRTVTIVNNSGEMHVHAAGCADLTKRNSKYAFAASQWNEDVADHRDIVNSIYGPDAGGFYEEAGLTEADWEEFDMDIKVYPCVGKDLPYDLGSRYDD